MPMKARENLLHVRSTAGGDELVKVCFPLTQDEYGYPPHRLETLWARCLSPTIVQLCNIPFYVRGLSCDDEVSVVRGRGRLMYESLQRSHGHSTYRVILNSDSEAPSLLKQVEALKCSWEGAEVPGFYAIDAPDATAAIAMANYLKLREQQGWWEFEEGCLAPGVPSVSDS